MKSDKFKKLVLQIEEQASEVKYDFQIAEAFRSLFEKFKSEISPDQEEFIHWEYLLFRLMTRNRFANEGLKTERFVPMITYTDGSIFPDPNSFSEKALTYFESRATSSTNPIFKARYLDFLWEKSTSEKKYIFAIEAVSQYLLTIDEYKNEDAFIEKLDGLQRAAELALILEKKQDSTPLSQSVVTKLNEQIVTTAKLLKYRWLLEMFELVVVLSKYYDEKEINTYIELCNTASLHYHQDNNYHIQRSFLKIKSQLTKLITNSNNSLKQIEEEIGQSYIDEAQAKSESGIVKVHFLQEAISHYTKLGDSAKVKELISEVKIATTQAIENNEFHKFSTTIEIKNEELEKMKKSLGIGYEIPQKIGTSSTFFPNWNNAVELTKKMSNEYISMRIGRVTFGEKYPINTPLSEEEQFEGHVIDNFRIDAELRISWLEKFVNELILEKKLSRKHFKKFLSPLKLLDIDTFETILKGVDFYFKRDYFSATYVLTLQLEDILRQFLALQGEETTIHVSGSFKEKTLGPVLRELKAFLPEPVYRYITWVMHDYRGLNLRNDIAHGFFKKKNTNAYYPTAILHILCLLVANTEISAK